MKIIGHRGASAHAPENTLAAFRLAWQQGADGIELDVRLSRDGRVMVHHDKDTRRTGGAERIIAITDSEVLRKLDVGRWRGEEFAGEPIPYLEEVLVEAPTGSRLLVEIKCSPEIISPLQAALRSVNPELHLALVSFHRDVLLACHEAMPQFPGYWILGCQPNARGACAPYPPKLIELARSHGLAGLDLDYRGLDPDFIAAAHTAGLKIFAWTVNDPDTARRLCEWGVDALASDYPAEIRGVLEV